MNGARIKLEGYGGNTLSASFWKGNDCAVVLLHGLRTDMREFAEFPACLHAAGPSVLALDFSGHGASAGQKGYISEKSHLEDTTAVLMFLRKNGIKKCIILGHSFGVHAALLASADHSLIEGLVFVAPQKKSGASLTRVKKLIFECLGFMARCAPFASKYIYLPISVSYRDLFVSDQAVAWAETQRWDPGKINLATLAYASRANNMLLAEKNSLPALVVIGQMDKKTSAESSEKFIESLDPKQTTVCRLTSSGHSPFADNDKDILLDAVTTFVQQTVSTELETEQR